MKLIYGTGNPAKLAWIRDILQGLPIEIIPIQDVLSNLPDVPETGSSPLENARQKANAYYKILHQPVFSCDSGLYFKELPDALQPGVHVRNVQGKRLSDEEMISYYTSLAKTYGPLHGYYQNAICIVVDEQHIYESMDETLQSTTFLLTQTPYPVITPGFPLDSISIDIDTNQYFCEMDFVDESVGNHGCRNFFIGFLNKHT